MGQFTPCEASAAEAPRKGREAPAAASAAVWMNCLRFTRGFGGIRLPGTRKFSGGSWSDYFQNSENGEVRRIGRQQAPDTVYVKHRREICIENAFAAKIE